MVGIERQRTPTNTKKTRGARGRVRNERVPMAPQAQVNKALMKHTKKQRLCCTGPLPDRGPDHLKSCHPWPPSFTRAAGSPTQGYQIRSVRNVSGFKSTSAVN